MVFVLLERLLIQCITVLFNTFDSLSRSLWHRRQSDWIRGPLSDFIFGNLSASFANYFQINP